MKHFPDLPPVWTLGAFVLSWVFAQILPIGQVKSFGVQLLGLAWIGIAVLIVLWACDAARLLSYSCETASPPKAQSKRQSRSTPAPTTAPQMI